MEKEIEDELENEYNYNNKQNYYNEYRNENFSNNENEYAKNYYSILGISRTATQEEIRKAYYKLMAKYHPDKNKNSDNSNTITKLINEAYEVLSDEEKREQYDRFGTTL